MAECETMFLELLAKVDGEVKYSQWIHRGAGKRLQRKFGTEMCLRVRDSLEGAGRIVFESKKGWLSLKEA